MKEIQILDGLPVIFTRDKEWVKQFARDALRPGQIIVLPEDAVLASPTVVEQKIMGRK